jgi:hypothetical protein
MKSQPWTFENGPQTAARVVREYGQQLLSSLPDVTSDDVDVQALVEGYRRVVAAALRAVRRSQDVHEPRLVTTRAMLTQRTHATAAVCRVVHLYLVALQLRQLEASAAQHDRVALVLVAERMVEQLVEDIEAEL